MKRILKMVISSCGECPLNHRINCGDYEQDGYYCHHSSLGYDRIILHENTIFHGDAHMDSTLPDWCPLEKGE